MSFRIFRVGGTIRDELDNVQSHDEDFTVVATGFTIASSAFDAFVTHITEQGFRVFESRPEFLTVRARVPIGHPIAARTNVADFVLARKDGFSSDGRRPDFVEAGTLHDDLARRDFTVNAMAMDEDGNLIDPFGGADDLASRTLRFVGDPEQRIAEDGLRVLRGFRFMVTKNLTPTAETLAAMTCVGASLMMGKVATERIREELNKMFQHDTLATLNLMATLPNHTKTVMFSDNLWLKATMEKK